MQVLQNIWKRDPAWLSVWVSIVISIWIVFTDDLINSDGVIYIQAAEKIVNGEWLESIKQYNWPLYSLLIALVSKISFVGLETSAYIVNVLLQALLAFSFVRCIQLLGGNNKVALFAIILLLTNVTMNAYRDQIIRDFGYWAFFFTALYFFIQYYQLRTAKYAIYFSVSMLVATLFRIEGIVFLSASPLLIISYERKYKENARSIILLLSPVPVLLVLILIYVMLTDITFASMGRLIDPISYFQNAYENMVGGIAEKGDLLEEKILSVHASDMGTKSMFAIFFMMFIVKIISASGYIPMFFAVTAYCSKYIKKTINNLNVINGFIVINTLVLTVFLLSHGFLSPRYTMTMGLLITLPAAFSLSYFMENNFDSSKWKKRAKIMLIIVFVYMFLDGITSFSASKFYIKESGVWLNKHMPVDAKLITNERTLYYYAEKELDSEAVIVATRISKGDFRVNKKDYDFLAMKIRKKKTSQEKNLIEWVGAKPIFRTSNERGDTVLIFKLNTKN